jgi:lysozyme
LSPGVHLYRKGKHKIASPLGYAAFRPANANEELPVTRSGKPSVGVAINIHKGGVNGTSSLGCQTIPPAQWESFRSTVYMLMDRYDQSVIPYVLTVNA